MNLINLVPVHRREARVRRIWRGRCIVICVAYSVLILALTTTAYALISRGNDIIPGRLAEAAEEENRVSTALAKTLETLEQKESQLRASRAIAGQPDWSELLALLAAKTQDQITLRGCSVSPRQVAAPRMTAVKSAGVKPATPSFAGILVSVSGAGISQTEVSQYALRLESTGLFNRVTIIETARETLADLQLVTFRLECTLGETLSPTEGKVTDLRTAAGGEP